MTMGPLGFTAPDVPVSARAVPGSHDHPLATLVPNGYQRIDLDPGDLDWEIHLATCGECGNTVAAPPPGRPVCMRCRRLFGIFRRASKPVHHYCAGCAAVVDRMTVRG